MKLSKLLKEVALDHGIELNEDAPVKNRNLIKMLDYLTRKGYDFGVNDERDSGKDGVKHITVTDDPKSPNQFVHFQHDRITDEFTITQASGYQIDQSKANRAGLRRDRDGSEVGKKAYMTDGNYTPTDIDPMTLQNFIIHVMTGLDREIKAQQDFYAKNPLADNVNEASRDAEARRSLKHLRDKKASGQAYDAFTRFMKPSEHGDIFYSEREGKAIGIRLGDTLYSMYVFDGEPKLGTKHRSDSRWENMGPASRGLLRDLAMKGVGGLYTRDSAEADARTLIQFVSDMTESVTEDKKFSSSEQKMVNQINRALKDEDPIYTLPTKTQDFYRKNKDMFSESVVNERLNVSRDILTALYKDRGATTFAQMILELRDENALDDLVEALQNQYTI